MSARTAMILSRDTPGIHRELWPSYRTWRPLNFLTNIKPTRLHTINNHVHAISIFVWHPTNFLVLPTQAMWNYAGWLEFYLVFMTYGRIVHSVFMTYGWSLKPRYLSSNLGKCIEFEEKSPSARQISLPNEHSTPRHLMAVCISYYQTLVNSPFVTYVSPHLCSYVQRHLWPLLLTWFNFNPSMDK